MRSAASPRGSGHARAADFGAALASAHDAALPLEARPVAGRGSTHRVRAGETLYGIAKARLAATGQAATPGASMRYALALAKSNQIRNPDRIYPGQTLELSAAAAVVGTSHAPAESIRSAAYATAYAVREPDVHDAMPAPDLPDEASARSNAAGHTIEPIEAEPEAAAAAGEILSTGDVRSPSDSSEKTRAALALYQQSATPAVPKPASEVPDLVYKGVVGKALDMVSLEPSTRTGLQQASAVIGNSFAGRSLAALTGLGGPLLTIAGLLWGIFSAQKIGAAQSGTSDQVAQNTSAE